MKKLAILAATCIAVGIMQGEEPPPPHKNSLGVALHRVCGGGFREFTSNQGGRWIHIHYWGGEAAPEIWVWNGKQWIRLP